jgi:hypothetical protein
MTVAGVSAYYLSAAGADSPAAQGASVTAYVRSGGRVVRVGAGRSGGDGVVRVKLTRQGRRFVNRLGGVAVRLRLRATAVDGTVVTGSLRVRLLPPRAAHGGAPTPEAALRRYAELSTNWTAASIAARQRQLAQLSIEGARQTALLAAQRAERDDTLRRAQVTNTGVVISIAATTGTASGLWVVVTRETTNGDDTYRGLPATYHVTTARLRRLRVGWVVRSWEPQS